MSAILIENLSKVFPNGTKALSEINLQINEGEFLVLVGPSGCGKTTLLRIIAGLDEPSNGSIKIDEKEVTKLAPKDRDLGMVFQNYALFPHLNIFKNLTFGLKAKSTDPNIIQEKVEAVSKKLGLLNLLERKPNQLSGGQKQRVALGRLLIRNPSIHLFDEPLSNLDANLRTDMRKELAELHKEYNRTSLFVTHDQIEAMTLGQRICVMNHGKIMQIGTPEEIYQKPANRFVAKFFGFPTINLFKGSFSMEKSVFEINESTGIPLPPEIENMNRKVQLGFRPEDWNIKEEPFSNSFPVELVRIENLGDMKILNLALDNISLTMKTDQNLFTEGQKYFLCPKWEKAHFFDFENGSRI